MALKSIGIYDYIFLPMFLLTIAMALVIFSNYYCPLVCFQISKGQTSNMPEPVQTLGPTQQSSENTSSASS
jgi:hypothetical protein